MIVTLKVASKRRLKELQKLMCEPHNTIRFIKNPVQSEEGYVTKLSMHSKDNIYLDFLKNKWQKEDNKLNKPTLKMRWAYFKGALYSVFSNEVDPHAFYPYSKKLRESFMKGFLVKSNV